MPLACEWFELVVLESRKLLKHSLIQRLYFFVQCCFFFFRFILKRSRCHNGIIFQWGCFRKFFGFWWEYCCKRILERHPDECRSQTVNFFGNKLALKCSLGSGATNCWKWMDVEMVIWASCWNLQWWGTSLFLNFRFCILLILWRLLKWVSLSPLNIRALSFKHNRKKKISAPLKTH